MFVPEPTVAQTIMILRGLRDTLEAHHKVTITDEAIDLIDEAAARVKISSSAQPVAVREMETEVHQLKRQQDDASLHKHFDRASEIQAQHDIRNKELQEATERWRQERGSASTEARTEQIA